MMKKSLILAAALSAAFAGSALADVGSQTYLEGGWQRIDVDGAGASDGLTLKGSYGFKDKGVYVFGQYGRQSDSGFDYDQFEAGAGYRHDFSDRLAMFGEAAWFAADGDFGFEADGYRVGVGLKAAMGDKFEGLVQVNHRDSNDIGNQTTGQLGLGYAFNPNWSMNGNVEVGADAQGYNLMVRRSF